MSDDVRSIASLALALRRGDTSPTELLEATLARIDTLDGGLNAFRELCQARAREEAHMAETILASNDQAGPLVGIPYAVKDLVDVAGLPTTAGFSGLADNVAAADARVVTLLGEAGMVLVGKTNTHQFAYGGTGINHDHGTPRNPWAAEPHVPGGSSSGSGVAVAADMVPMALGTDTGGSVRIPAALCGVTGLKTTVGQVSRRGVYPLSRSLDSVGPLCRTVEDAAYVYDAIQGPEQRDPTTLGHPKQDVLATLQLGIQGVRVGLPQTVFWDDVDPEVREAVLDCARALDGLGATVEEIPFEIAQRTVELNPRGRAIAAEAYAANRVWVDDHLDELDPVVGPRLIAGRDISAADYLATVEAWERLRLELEDDHSWDILLCPTTQRPALPVDAVDADIDTYLKANLRYLRNTTIGNILGLCGLSVPCGFTESGLPIGAMIYGRPFREDQVLRAGWAYQEDTDWHLRKPPLA
jgi:aspartyl-tRNA(Asn)/glutamyl-tRNA(Gln) amidotransferase subunit A